MAIIVRLIKNNYENKVQSVMVNNSTNINRMKNYLSSQTIEHKKTMTYYVVNPVAWLGDVIIRHKNVVVLNQLFEFQPSTSDK